MTVRAFLWSAHRWIGLACAVPFLVLTVTGIALLIDHSIGLGATPRLDDPARGFKGVDHALAGALRERSGATPSLILPGIDDRHAWTIMLRPGNGSPLAIDFDPVSGRLVGLRPAGSTLNETLLAIHNSLALGSAGKVVILLMAIGLLILAISGFAVMRRRWRVLTRSPLTGPSPFAALHRWAGLVGMAFIVLWAATGFFLLSVKSLGDFGPARPRPVPVFHVTNAPIAPMLAQALGGHPGQELQGVMPGVGGKPTMIMLLDRDAPPWAKSTTLLFDSRSGAALRQRPAPSFMKLMLAAKSLHTGLWDGWRVRSLYLVASLLPLILVITGPWLWLRRRFTPRPKASRQ